MKKALLLLALLTLGACSQKKEFSLLGKWKLQTKSAFNKDENKPYLKEVENGRIIIFEKGNIAIDGLGNKGKYEVMGDSLHISFPQTEEFYYFYGQRNHLSLTPLTPQYKHKFDEEPCIFGYEKI